jgi:hypothetical protein
MRSAYLWAGSLGLPDTRTYKRCKRPWAARDGLYRVKLLHSVPSAPFPYNQVTECLATNTEIETYNLPIAEVVAGVTWRNLTDPGELLNCIQCVSTWKQAARCYWGRWAQTQKVKCHTTSKTWELPNPALNIPWAHLIVSRVRMRLWENSSKAVHVFIDSVITTDTLRTGDALGDWRLEKTYQDGVIIRGPGQYGAMGAERLERMAGVPLSSPHRYNSVAVANN